MKYIHKLVLHSVGVSFLCFALKNVNKERTQAPTNESNYILVNQNMCWGLIAASISLLVRNIVFPPLLSN